MDVIFRFFTNLNILSLNSIKQSEEYEFFLLLLSLRAYCKIPVSFHNQPSHLNIFQRQLFVLTQQNNHFIETYIPLVLNQ